MFTIMSQKPTEESVGKRRLVALLILSKMALSDDQVQQQESQLLQDMLDLLFWDMDEKPNPTELIEQARGEDLETLCQGVDQYEDRFFIAMRAYTMAFADNEFDIAEEELFNRLIKIFQILPKDLRLIRETELMMRSAKPKPLDPRVEDLYKRSSFFQP
jgi:uncharacterized tellurite resistance protein B-like protein